MTARLLEKVQEYERSLKRVNYEVGKLYEVATTINSTGAERYYIAQPGELGYTKDYCLYVGSLILCVQSGYLVEKPSYPSGTSWPINNFNGLTQGNLFLYNNHIFFIPVSYTYYDQHLLLKEVETP